MPDNLQEKLEGGRFIFRDKDCMVTVEKGSCGHFTVMVTGLIGLTGMHYTSYQDLLDSPFDINKFTYAPYGENEIINITPLD